MNLLQLVLKQMRQRALSTWLTLLSVALGVALAVAILILQRESESLFAQRDYGFDLVVGAKGSPTQLVLNSVYQMDQPVGTIPYIYIERLRTTIPGASRWRIPFAVLVDNYEGYRVFATEPALFRADDEGNPTGNESGFAPRLDQPFEFAEGRAFHRAKFEAVLGSKVAEATGLKLGDTFRAAHDLPSKGVDPHEHDEQWTVVGILKPTGTSFDRLIFLPLISTYAIAEHEVGMTAQARLRGVAPPLSTPLPATAATREADHEHDHPAEAEGDHDHDHPATAATQDADHDHDHAGHGEEAGHDDHEHNHLYHLEPDGTIHLHLPKEQWMVTGAFVRATQPPQIFRMIYDINNGNDAQAASPALVMREFFETFLAPGTLVLIVVAVLVIIVAGVSILVSIYNSISARTREIAILRALGATRGRIVAIICIEATLIGVIGGLAGLVLGHLTAAVGSAVMQRIVGQSIAWYVPTAVELWFLLGVAALSLLAGLVPALKAYRTPVADNLVAV